MEDIVEEMLKIWLTIIVLLFSIYIIRLVAKKEIEMKNVISWLLLCLIALPVIWFQSVISFIATNVGIEIPSNFVFFLGFCLLVYLNFSLTRITSKQSVQIRELTQKIALQEKKNEE